MVLKHVIKTSTQGAVIQIEDIQLAAKLLHHIVYGEAEEQWPEWVTLLHSL